MRDKYTEPDYVTCCPRESRWPVHMLLCATSIVVNLKVGSLLGAMVWVNETRSSGSCGGEKMSSLEDGGLMKCVATLSLVYLALLIVPVWLSSCVKSKVITLPHSRAASTPRCKYLCCRGSTNPALLWEERNRICWVGTGGGQKILKRIESWIPAYWKPCMSSLSAELKILHTNIF